MGAEAELTLVDAYCAFEHVRQTDDTCPVVDTILEPEKFLVANAVVSRAPWENDMLTAAHIVGIPVETAEDAIALTNSIEEHIAKVKASHTYKTCWWCADAAITACNY